MQERLLFVEGIYGSQEGKDAVFDEMRDKINAAEIERHKFIAQANAQL